MNKESNTYTLIYASVMVILVAIGLAFTSESLKDLQKKNEDIDKMRQILRAVNVESTADDADAKFSEIIDSSFVINAKGEHVDRDAFAIDMKEEQKKKKEEDKAYPVFVANIDGQSYFVMAMRGTGLWGPIWGYISVGEDKNTVYGSDFSHEGETPGLGAEIATPKFSSEFNGKHLFMDGEFKSIAVVKAGKSVDGQDYVDGISGGTITSKGVNAMLFSSLEVYRVWLSEE